MSLHVYVHHITIDSNIVSQLPRSCCTECLVYAYDTLHDRSTCTCVYAYAHARAHLKNIHTREPVCQFVAVQVLDTAHSSSCMCELIAAFVTHHARSDPGMLVCVCIYIYTYYIYIYTYPHICVCVFVSASCTYYVHTSFQVVRDITSTLHTRTHTHTQTQTHTDRHMHIYIYTRRHGFAVGFHACCFLPLHAAACR